MRRKLSLHRETLRTLGEMTLGRARAGLARFDEVSIQSGETHCWCSDSCPPGGPSVEPVETSACLR